MQVNLSFTSINTKIFQLYIWFRQFALRSKQNKLIKIVLEIGNISNQIINIDDVLSQLLKDKTTIQIVKIHQFVALYTK